MQHFPLISLDDLEVDDFVRWNTLLDHVSVIVQETEILANRNWRVTFACDNGSQLVREFMPTQRFELVYRFTGETK